MRLTSVVLKFATFKDFSFAEVSQPGHISTARHIIHGNWIHSMGPKRCSGQLLLNVLISFSQKFLFGGLSKGPAANPGDKLVPNILQKLWWKKMAAQLFLKTVGEVFSFHYCCLPHHFAQIIDLKRLCNDLDAQKS